MLELKPGLSPLSLSFSVQPYPTPSPYFKLRCASLWYRNTPVEFLSVFLCEAQLQNDGSSYGEEGVPAHPAMLRPPGQPALMRLRVICPLWACAS